MNTSHLNHFADSMFGIEKTPAEADAEVARYTAHRALPLRADNYDYARAWVAPQGRIEQGWPARRCSPEPEIMVIDRLPEDYDQTDSADGEVLAWLLKGLAVVMLACFSAWCIASYLELARV
jgi:hypothetical protein